MYTEIIKIIEGGLNKDPQKVISYAKLLAENLSKDGDKGFADKILKVLLNQKGAQVFQDQIITSPVDQDSRMSMADIIMPSHEKSNLILSDSLQTVLDGFVATLKHGKEIRNAGVEMNSALLLYGPPGCGKTSIAKYLAEELQLPLVVTRFDSLISSLLGNTAKNIRKIFEYANTTPCILFLDEFDAIAKARDDQHEMGELKRVINSLLQNIDQFTENGNILIAATNHQELLDKAIWRRFNFIVEVGKPEENEIRDLVTHLFRNIGNDFLDNKKMDNVIELLKGQSHSDIKKISNNTISKAIINNKQFINIEDIMFQYFLFKHNNNYNNQELVKFLNENGISRNSISEMLNISARQVMNFLK